MGEGNSWVRWDALKLWPQTTFDFTFNKSLKANEVTSFFIGVV
jgi:hypothetical protein